jgi:hypothetical protein
MSCLAWQFAEQSTEQKRSVTADLGQQVHRVHTLPPSSDAARDYP